MELLYQITDRFPNVVHSQDGDAACVGDVRSLSRARRVEALLVESGGAPFLHAKAASA
jgi:hypothetical protein